jgi:hypothetical protein
VTRLPNEGLLFWVIAGVIIAIAGVSAVIAGVIIAIAGVSAVIARVIIAIAGAITIEQGVLLGPDPGNQTDPEPQVTQPNARIRAHSLPGLKRAPPRG